MNVQMSLERSNGQVAPTGKSRESALHAQRKEQTMVTSDAALDSRPVKLSCESIWKIYGENADHFLATVGDKATAEDIAAANVVCAVRNVNLEIREGETFIVMGLSGSGKSTLLRCLSRLIEPTCGQVMLDGKDLRELSDAELIDIRRHKMGMVFQNFALLPHLTVLENIAFPLAIQGIDKKTREARAREVIELVSLKGRETFYPRELSGGQQQRVGIARSLAVKPEIWFLDEPFSALDPLIRREMQAEILRLQSVLKKTVIFITHDFDEAIRLGDRIAIMKDGAVIQVGTPEDLVMNPATDYVSEFTRDVQRAKVMSALSIMQPLTTPPAEFAGLVKASDKIASFAERVVETKKPVGITDKSGALIGEISFDAVIRVLASASEAKGSAK